MAAFTTLIKKKKRFNVFTLYYRSVQHIAETFYIWQQTTYSPGKRSTFNKAQGATAQNDNATQYGEKKTRTEAEARSNWRSRVLYMRSVSEVVHWNDARFLGRHETFMSSNGFNETVLLVLQNLSGALDTVQKKWEDSIYSTGQNQYHGSIY